MSHPLSVVVVVAATGIEPVGSMWTLRLWTPQNLFSLWRLMGIPMVVIAGSCQLPAIGSLGPGSSRIQFVGKRSRLETNRQTYSSHGLILQNPASRQAGFLDPSESSGRCGVGVAWCGVVWCSVVWVVWKSENPPVWRLISVNAVVMAGSWQPVA